MLLKRRKEEEKFSLDLKTNNDSSYNRNKPSKLCQTQTSPVENANRREERSFPLSERAALHISGKVVTTNRLRPFHLFLVPIPLNITMAHHCGQGHLTV